MRAGGEDRPAIGANDCGAEALSAQAAAAGALAGGSDESVTKPGLLYGVESTDGRDILVLASLVSWPSRSAVLRVQSWMWWMARAHVQWTVRRRRPKASTSIALPVPRAPGPLRKHTAIFRPSGGQRSSNGR